MSDSTTWVSIISHLSKGQIHKVPQQFSLEADEVTLLSSTSFNDLVANATEFLRRNGWIVSQHFKHSTRSHEFYCAHQNPEEHAAAALRAAGHHPESNPKIHWGSHCKSRRNRELSYEEKRLMVMAATGFTEDPEFTHSGATTAAASVTEHFLSRQMAAFGQPPTTQFIPTPTSQGATHDTRRFLDRQIAQMMAAAGLPPDYELPAPSITSIQEWANQRLGQPFETLASAAAQTGLSISDLAQGLRALNPPAAPPSWNELAAQFTAPPTPPPPPAKPVAIHIRPGTRKILRTAS
jgi:hypothetical protein